MKTALDIAVPYPETMGQGIDDWLTATKEAGRDVEVLFREDGTDRHGLAIVATLNRYGHRITAWTRTLNHHLIEVDPQSRNAHVSELRSVEDGHGWDYQPIWSGDPTEIPAPYKEGSTHPHLIVLHQLHDDDDMYRLRASNGQVRATVVSGGSEAYAAWKLGALHLTSYTMEYLNTSSGRSVGRPTPGREIAEEVRYWETIDREQHPHLHH